ncbi:hypothetical protein MJN47_28010, partial [Salmonella enterica subsp. enterica serovar Lubbock]|nr:hypothetical protein [Salmonella enterica subsp. enterica serovar Lubbock]
ASDIHFLISESIFKVRMRIFGELQTVDEDQPALGYSLCATAIDRMAVDKRSQPNLLIFAAPVLILPFSVCGVRHGIE